MPYGSGQRLGETIDPRLMQADYSGFTNAAAVAGNTLANIGQQIGAGIKQNNENQKEIAGKIKMAEAMKKAVPGLGEMADKVIGDLTNPDLSTRDKLRASAGINEAMQVLLLGNQENRANASLKIQQDQLGLEAAKIEAALNAPKKRSKSTIGLGDGSEMDVLIDESGNMTDVFGNPIGGQGTQNAGASVQNGLPPQTKLSNNLPNALKPFAGDFQALGSKYKVDPNLLAAISIHETGNGTSSAFLNKKNAMGVSDESGPIQMGSVPESIERMARLLGQGINEGTGPYAGVKSIGDIASIYAPLGAGNDPNNLNQNWTSGVTLNLQKLTQNAEANRIADASQPRYGVRSPKPTSRFRTATKEEAARNNATAGQVDEITGRFYREDLPSGMELKSDGEGGFTLIQGAGAGSKGQTPEQVAKTKAADERMFSSIYGSSVTVLDQIEKTLSDNPALAKIQGGIGKAFPASEEGQINAAIENIKIENSKAFIFDLKDRTGAVGQTTEREWPKYENRFGPIGIGMNPDQMLKTIKLNSLNSFEAIYGSPDDMKEKLDEGDINKSQYDSYVNDYLIAREELKIPDEGILGNKRDWSKLPEGLKSIKNKAANPFTLDQTLDQDIDNFLNQ